MANNYSMCTVQPSIPESLMIPLERMLLETLFAHEKQGERIYFYTEDSINYFGTFNYFELLNAATVAKSEKTAPELADFVLKLLKKNGETEGEIELELDSLEFGKIFESITRRAGKKLEYIVVEGSWTCDKMRAGEFGGHASIHTAKGSSYYSTSDWLAAQIKRRKLPHDKYGSA